MNVAWNPDGATGSVPLVLSVAVGKGPGASAPEDLIYTAANCTVLASAGTFTIPAYALLALPPTDGTFLTFRPGDSRPTGSALFSASGLNLGIAQVTILDIGSSSPQKFHLQ
jgi:hypothetical protein